ncbi:hypothetical protein NWFMUON74_62090 [Nocardia wallacei]|uniref:Uncharacterized protein n=1 Tax=Nocardia wallacei TaxID=480035 RepID=A0A7G1KT99_9NOCA|nr:hypothetical protein NWFMUON74_62090 [Nocardia wallacei]
MSGVRGVVPVRGHGIGFEVAGVGFTVGCAVVVMGTMLVVVAAVVCGMCVLHTPNDTPMGYQVKLLYTPGRYTVRHCGGSAGTTKAASLAKEEGGLRFRAMWISGRTEERA